MALTLRKAQHRLHIATEMLDGRWGWECSCGHSGSVGEFGDPEVAAEKHIPRDESVVYVSRLD